MWQRRSFREGVSPQGLSVPQLQKTGHLAKVVAASSRNHPDRLVTGGLKALARSYLWWPGLDRELKKLAKAKCQKEQSSPAVASLHPWSWPTRPWARVHLNFAGPFQGCMFLVAVRRCPLQVARGGRNVNDYSYPDSGSAEEDVCSKWIARTTSFRQWTTIHVRRICYLLPIQWVQRHSCVPLLLKWLDREVCTDL